MIAGVDVVISRFELSLVMKLHQSAIKTRLATAKQLKECLGLELNQRSPPSVTMFL